MRGIPWLEAERRSSWFAGAAHKSGGGGTQEVIQKSDPPEFAQPFYKQAMGAAQQEFEGGPPSFFPGSTVIPFSPQTETALGAQEMRARTGNPLVGAAQQYTGQMLTDPTQTAPFQSIMAEVGPQVAAQFSSSGRYGSNLHADSLGKGLGRAMAPYMESAANRAAPLAREDYFDIGQLAQVGGAREGQKALELQEQLARHDFGENVQAGNIAEYMRLIAGGAPGGQQTTTQPLYGGNPALGALGGATSGAMMGSMFGPWGMGIGAAGGGLLGLMS